MKKWILGITILLAAIIFTVFPVYADQDVGDAQEILGSIVPKTGVTTDNIFVIAGNIIQGALSLVGLIFLIIMIYGGFVWMTAQGNEQRIEKAKQSIRAAIIGIVVVVSAYAITNFLTTNLFPESTDVSIVDEFEESGFCLTGDFCSADSDCSSDSCDLTVNLCDGVGGGFDSCFSDSECVASGYGPGARCIIF